MAVSSENMTLRFCFYGIVLIVYYCHQNALIRTEMSPATYENWVRPPLPLPLSTVFLSATSGSHLAIGAGESGAIA